MAKPVQSNTGCSKCNRVSIGKPALHSCPDLVRKHAFDTQTQHVMRMQAYIEVHPIARDFTDKPTLYLTVVIAKGVVAHLRHWTTPVFADTESGRVLGRGTVCGILDTKTSEVTAHQAGREHYVVEAVLLAQGRDDGANQGPPALIPRPRGNPGVAQDPSGAGSATQAWKHPRVLMLMSSYSHV